jgi:hypothetical protein
MNRIAICLALLAAVAAPLASGTWHMTANAQTWIALTADHRAQILVKLDSSKNCRYFETQVEARDALGLTVDPADIQDALLCHREQDALRDGGEMQATFSLPRYLAVNGGAALASALVMLGLAIMLPALLRRYRWRLPR